MLFRFAPRAGAAIDPRRDVRVAKTELSLGRAEHCDIRLAHADVHFEHATLRVSGKALILTAKTGAQLQRDDTKATTVELRAEGESVRIGPYTLTRAPDAADGEPVIHVMPDAAAPSEDDAAVAAWYARAFDTKLPNIRLMAFGLTLAVLAIFFLLPFTLSLGPNAAMVAASDRALPIGTPAAQVSAPVNALWNVGAFSSVHSGFAENCAHCHAGAFEHTQNSACLDCHRDIGQHADPVAAPAADLNKERCENCHLEHKGKVLATKQSQADCVSCHGDIKTWAPNTREVNVRDFGTDHPQFAPGLVSDAVLHKVEKIELGSADRPDKSGLLFTHQKHLVLDKLKKLPGDQVCAACHLPTADATSFKQPEFESACASCHELQFEPLHPEWRLPHGNAEDVAPRIAGYYARAALNGESFTPPTEDLFKKPGDPLPPPPPSGTALVDAQTATAMMSAVARSACGQCHVVSKPAEGEPATKWTVAPVWVPDHYEPAAMFSHAAHSTSACATCHASRESNGGPLALLPPIKTCQQCHAGEAGGIQRVASTCVLCHGFHDKTRPLLGVMPINHLPARQTAELTPIPPNALNTPILPAKEAP